MTKKPKSLKTKQSFQTNLTKLANGGGFFIVLIDSSLLPESVSTDDL